MNAQILRILTLAVLISSAARPTLAFANLDEYSYSQLDALWQSGLGSVGPDAAWYQILTTVFPEIPRPVAAPLGPLVDPTAPIDDDEERLPPREASVPATEPTTPAGSGGERRYFAIVRAPAEAESKALRRLVDANIYLTRQRQSSGNSTALELGTLVRRQHSAFVEVELGAMLQFFAEPTLAGKCRRAGHVLDAQAAGTKTLTPSDVEASWAAALGVLKVAQTRLNWVEMRQTLCRVRPVMVRASTESRARAALLLLVEKRVKELGKDEVIMARPKADPVTGEIPLGKTAKNAPLVLMRAERENMTIAQSRASNISIPLADASANPPLADMGILSLRRYVNNVEANMSIAKDDILCGVTCPSGKTLLSQMKEMKLDDNANLKRSLTTDPTLPHLKATAELATIKTDLDAIIASLRKLPTDLPSAYGSRVASCGTLVLPWPGTAQAQTAFAAALDSCLDKVALLTADLQTMTDQDGIDREFARRAMQLSQKILQRLTR